MGLFVEVTGHFLGQQCLHYICCTEDDTAAQELQCNLEHQRKDLWYASVATRSPPGSSSIIRDNDTQRQSL